MSSNASYAELQEERDYLLSRAEWAGHATFNAGRWVGISSNALVRYVFGGPEPTERDFPRDPSDLISCYRAVRRLPDHLRARGESILPLYREAVAARYDLAEHDAINRAEVALGRLSEVR